MLAKLRERLAALQHSLLVQRPLLTRARRRYRSFHKRAYKAMKQKEAAMEAADKLREEGHPGRAERKDAKALRLSGVEERNRAKKVFWRGRAKVLAKRVHGIETDIASVEKEIAELGPTVKGNKVSGGTREERWKLACLTAAANCSTGRRRNFYSQSGSWDIKHEIAPGPEYGERSDCSQFVTGIAWSCGLPDPNGAGYTGGYTGTLIGQHHGWKLVSYARLQKIGWGYIVYGGGVGHHTEAYVGGGRTVGHGSAPVDFGVPDLFGDGDFRCYAYLPS